MLGDWFVMMLVSRNVTQWMFQDVIEDLGEKIRVKNI